ncbi:SRPBCC family protein [Mycolicibacillus trivialis]
MPVVESSVRIPVDPATAFAVSQTTGETRLRWDPFISKQWFVDGATAPAKGVRTHTRHWSGLTMISEYVSFNPPTNVGIKVIKGPWFFSTFGSGWRFNPAGDGGTVATWRYSFTCRPAWLAPLAERIGRWWLGRDIDKRIAGFARGCADPVVLAAVGHRGTARQPE